MQLIHHVVTGDVRQPMVFVHGFACDHSDWQAQVAHFAVRWQTVTVDLRGHGNAEPDSYMTLVGNWFRDMFTADSDPTLVASTIARAASLPRSIGQSVLLDMVRYDADRLPDAGHFPQIERSTQTNALLDGFVTALVVR